MLKGRNFYMKLKSTFTTWSDELSNPIPTNDASWFKGATGHGSISISVQLSQYKLAV